MSASCLAVYMVALVDLTLTLSIQLSPEFVSLFITDA